jgi:hypothetical protein
VQQAGTVGTVAGKVIDAGKVVVTFATNETIGYQPAPVGPSTPSKLWGALSPLTWYVSYGPMMGTLIYQQARHGRLSGNIERHLCAMSANHDCSKP